MVRGLAVASLSALLMGCPPAVVSAHPQAERNNGLCVEALAGKELVQARIHCEHALEFDDRWFQPWVNLGLISQLEGKLPEARAAYIRALRLNPEAAQAYNNLGVMDLDAGDLRLARERFERALKVNPDYLEARRNLAEAWLKLGDLAQAERAARHLLASDPQLVEAYLLLGGISLAREEWPKAEGFFQRAIALRTAEASAWKGLGLAQERQARWALAAQAYEACLDQQADAQECRDGLSRARSAAQIR